MRYALAALLLAGSACGRSGEPEREERRQVMEGLTLSQSVKGSPAWTLKSARAVLREDAKLAVLTEPVMEFYKKGKAISRVTALSGEVDTESHGVRLSSSVVLDSFDDHSRLTTTDLFYDSTRDRFTTAADILVKRPEGVLRGRGLEAKPDLSEIRIFNQSSTLSGKSR